MRTCEALALHHAADGADTLLDAGRCFEQLARTAEAMATLGGVLASTDDGFVQVDYPRVEPATQQVAS